MKQLPVAIEDWPAFSRLLDAANALGVAHDERARAAWLAALNGADARLRPALERVLAHMVAAPAADFLVGGPRLAPLPSGDAAPALHAGQAIGPYELCEPLGQGGMGVVWRARRIDGAYERDVALKLPHAHLLAGDVRQRFARERDILASLEHPHIARFLDAGLAANGQPYLALEVVRGQPITAWAHEQRLGVNARLAMFRQALAAVAHAHARLVAHRDLKPANVLVTEAGEVRLLDFGIAKLMDGDAAAQAELTRADQRLITPGYAAPEQRAGGAITAATDLYALGTMLFELLAGTPPFPAAPSALGARLASSTIADQDGEPPMLSRHATPEQAANLGITPRALSRRLGGDLDAIVAKAMQPRPEQRYESAAAFDADLASHLAGRPILARRISAARRAGLFVRRHRSSVAASVLVTASVVAGTAGVAWQSQRALAEARRAEAVKGFLLDVFKASDPRIASDTPRGQVTAKALLDASIGRIDTQFEHDPPLRIELLRTAADIYRELGEIETYDSLQARQLALVRQHFGPLHENVIDGLLEAAVMAMQRGDLAACREHLAEADRSMNEAGRDDPLRRAAYWTQRSVCLRDQPEAAAERMQALERALALLERHAPASRDRVTALAELATELQHRGKLAESIAAGRRVVALAEALPDRNDAELLTLHGNLGLGQMQLGELADAEASFARAAEIAQRTSGVTHRSAWRPASQRARSAHLGGARERAQAMFAELMPALPAESEPDPEVSNVREDYAACLASEGRPLEAIPLLEGVERDAQSAAQFEFTLRRVRRVLGDAYARAGRAAEARRMLKLALDDYDAHERAAAQPTIAARERWGRFLLDQGERAEARQQLERAVAVADNPHWSHVALAQAGLARLALDAGDLPGAQAASQAALDTWRQLEGFRDQRYEPYLWRVRAAVIERAGDAAGAARLRADALAASRRYDAPESPTTRDEGKRLAL